MTKTQTQAAGSTPAPGSTVPSTISNRKQKLDEVAVRVLEHLQELQETGNINFPPNYSKENAVKGAMIFLSEATDKDGNYLIDKCTLPSIANSIMAMCIDGLSIWKKQGYFIPYRNKATQKFEMHWQPDYRGHILLAKRDADVKEVNAQCIYEGDDFKYEVDVTNGRQKIIQHTLDLNNQDIGKIKGAYAVVVFNDGSSSVEIMTLAQLRQAWLMGAAEGDSKAHKNFTDRMCRRTVINRATNNLIGSSDDSEVMPPEDENKPVETRNKAIKEKAGSKSLNIQDTKFEEVKDDPYKGTDNEGKGPERTQRGEPETKGEPDGTGNLADLEKTAQPPQDGQPGY